MLMAHLKRYPLMGPEDCAKLIYQSEFAAEHMLPSPELALRCIEQELAEVAPCAGDLYEAIGPGLARLHFAPAKATGMDAAEICRIFTSGASRCGSPEGQQQKLSLLEQLCRDGQTPFSPTELYAFLRDYQAAGCPPLHHSAVYRRAYQPHYRVVRREG